MITEKRFDNKKAVITDNDGTTIPNSLTGGLIKDLVGNGMSFFSCYEDERLSVRREDTALPEDIRYNILNSIVKVKRKNATRDTK